VALSGTIRADGSAIADGSQRPTKFDVVIISRAQ
jgi:hypothetical protein